MSRKFFWITALLLAVTFAGSVVAADTRCGCQDCTEDVLNTMVGRHKLGRHKCGDRISYLMDEHNLAESDACTRVADKEFPLECGKCNPKNCNGKAHKKPDFYCGCKACTEAVWNRMTTDYTCGARISYLTDVSQMPLSHACGIVSGQFPEYCGLCDPQQCSPTAATEQESAEELANTNTVLGDGFTEHSLHARTPLYCFPSFKNRTRFRNVWGRYTVEVKESDATCGPGDNKFTTNTVSLLENRQIKLQFKKVGNTWEASEVRVRLPENQMPFPYGEFSFSVKSVEIIDSNSGTVLDNVLPPSLVLGLFSWDATENYAEKENMNHEVDIEISRWNIAENEDLQFLVQPPGNPQLARFFSGPNESLLQAPRKFSFLWNPGKIEWQGDRGESHSYSVQDALDSGAPDFTQCLPADAEVRMNLWNMLGTSRPTGMADHHIAEVVIDDFKFTPSGKKGLKEGATCSKSCQCKSLSCVENQCRKSRNLEGETTTMGNSGTIRSTVPLRAENSHEDGSVVGNGLIMKTYLLIIAAFVLVLRTRNGLFKRLLAKGAWLLNFQRTG